MNERHEDVVAGAGGQPNLLAVLGEDRVPGQHVDSGVLVAVIIGGRIMHQRWSEG